MITIEQASGRVVRALRRERGLTLQQLGERAGVTKSSLSKWENHGENVSLTTLVGVCAGLSVAPGVFLAMADATRIRPRLAGRDRELIPAKPGVPALRMKIVRAPKPLPLRRTQR